MEVPSEHSVKELDSVDALATVVADDTVYTKEERTRSESPDGGDTRGQPVIDHQACGGECARGESPDGVDTRGNPVIDHRACKESVSEHERHSEDARREADLGEEDRGMRRPLWQ